MKRTLLLMVVAVMASMMTLSAKKHASDKPEDERIVLKAARDFNAIVLNAPVTVELIKDSRHPGVIVYHSTKKGELKVYSKGQELIVGVQDEWKNKPLHVTSRVVVCYDGDIRSIVVNGSGSVLAKRIDVDGDMKCKVNGSGDIKIDDMFAKGTFDGAVNGSGDLGLSTLEASVMIAKVNGSGDMDIKKCTIGTSAVLSVNGSGDLDVKSIKATGVSASVNGSGDLSVKGTAVDAELSLNGSGDLKAGSLDAESTVVTGSGSGDIYCRASRSLNVKAQKSCDVHVRGPRPAQINIKADNMHFDK